MSRRHGEQVLVINLHRPRCSWTRWTIRSRAVERELDACPLGAAADAILVDMHGEATSEKMAIGHFCDGRAALVAGTHTHVPTADAQILPAAPPT